MTEITIGGVQASESNVRRMAMVLWGPAGLGKTTLACTLPGRKALINFDPDGPASIPKRDDIQVFDLAGAPDNLILSIRSSDPLGLSSVVEHFDSFIIDSITSISERGLKRGIDTVKGATLERPSPGAYQARNNITAHLVREVLRITAAHDKHVCFIAHEGAPDKDDEGRLLGYSMMLGGQLPAIVASKINECWPMFEDSKNRKMIICRKSRLRDPAKSRMFNVTNDYEFEWRFDPTNWDDNEGMRISDWFEAWRANDFEKIRMPT